MKKLILVLSLIILCSKLAQLQNLFLKTYDFGTVEDSYQIILFEGRIFISTATYCTTECSYLAEIDESGIIIWRTQVPDIDIASGSMIIANDTITITGNNAITSTMFLMAHYSLNGEKLGPTLEINHPASMYTNMFLLTSQKYNGKFALCGKGVQENVHKSLIYIVNNSGILDTLIAIEPTNKNSDIWDSYIDNEGRLTTFHKIEFVNPDRNYRKIYKFNADLDTIWSYTSEDNNRNSVIPRGCELHDGRISLSFINPQGIRNIHSIRAVNQVGGVDWQHNYQVSPTKNRYILRLKTLSNGDIMGCGTYSERSHVPFIDDALWLFRMSPNGVLKWERTYFDIDSTINRSRYGVLFDFIELDNNDILATGFLKYENNDMLIMRVDSNGCLNQSNCHEVNLITNYNYLLEQININVYPNPVGSKLYLTLPFQNKDLSFKIFDIYGRQIQSGSIVNETTEIDMSDFPLGIYYLSIFDRDVYYFSSKFIKIAYN